MRLYSCHVRLKGSMYNTVPKYDVTAAEIAVLKLIHTGEDAGGEVVIDIKPTGDVGRTDREERARLHEIYGKTLAKRDPRKGAVSIDALFGLGTKLPDVVEGEAVVVDEPIRRTRVPKAAPAEQHDELAAMA